MKKIKFKSSITASNFKDGEKKFSLSQTVPDQHLSVREIIYRSQNGTLGNVYREPLFSDENPDLRGLDISEIYNLQKQHQDNIRQLQLEVEIRTKKEFQEMQAKKLELIKNQAVQEFKEKSSEKV